MFQKIKDWWKQKGKIVVAQLLLTILVINPLFKQFTFLKDYLLDDHYYFVLIGTVLMLFLQILLSFDKRENFDDELHLLKTDEDKFLEKIEKAKTLCIMFSSSESIFLSLKDILLSRKVYVRLLVTVQVVLHNILDIEFDKSTSFYGFIH